MLKRRKNYKLLAGLICGMFLSFISVYAATTYLGTAANLTYNNEMSGLNSTNVQGALEELYSMKYHSWCPTNYECLPIKPGDYVSYTPNKTSYTTDKSKTGYSKTQTINPSELNVWRVLSVNSNGSVEIISQKVSSSYIYFSGLTGYKNLVGYLNVLASQYANSTYTSGSRYFGYNGQTAYITSSTYFTNPAPWPCPTGGTCSPDPDDYEAYGGGDTLYLRDYNLVNTVLGTRKAYAVGYSENTGCSYWIASRYYSGTTGFWSARLVSDSGSSTTNMLYQTSGANTSAAAFLRPIVTLKPGVIRSGYGTSSSPWALS